MYEVQWDQWYRCGRCGDDTNYEYKVMTFDTLALAEAFVDDLVQGKYSGYADMKVHRDEVKIVATDPSM
jgi:hypothetical protein